jgi:uncharacterized ferredoxin-like protein
MQIETMLSVILWGLGIITGLIGIIVALGVYIYQEHVRNTANRFDEHIASNEKQFDILREDIKELRKSND